MTGRASSIDHEGAAIAQAISTLRRSTNLAGRPLRAFHSPGRIEVLGKHTDYGGGRSLLAAVERGFTIVAAPREDDVVTVVDTDSNQHARFHLDPALRPIPGGWRNYPMTVARRIARNFPDARFGADIAFTSDLPSAAGLSSSSAFVIGIFLVLAAVNRLSEMGPYRESIQSTADLADYLGAVENGLDYRALAGDLGVGTRGGSQDQTAILCARPDALVQFAFGPVRFEREVPLPADYTFAIASSGVRASKTGAALGAYNGAAAEMARLLRIWREGTGRDDRFLGAALESDPAAVVLLRELIGRGDYDDDGPRAASIRPAEITRLSARLEQFAAEVLEIIPAAGAALGKGDLDTVGRLVDRSQRLAESGLGNQIEETIALQRMARELGALAASAFGAGFGGSVWALVPTAAAPHFLDLWRRSYQARFPGPAATAEFFLTRAAAGARSIPL